MGDHIMICVYPHVSCVFSLLCFGWRVRRGEAARGRKVERSRHERQGVKIMASDTYTWVGSGI